MSTPMIYSYDRRQPDPEIWGGGETVALFNITSGLGYSEKRSRKYNLEITPGSSATGMLSVSGGSSTEYVIKKYVGDLPTYLTSNIGVEHVEYVPPTSDLELKITGTSVVKHIFSKTTNYTIDLTENSFSEEKIGYSYNEDSLESFSTKSFGEISFNSDLTEDYGDINQISFQGNEEFGFIFDINSSITPFGNINVSGSAIVIDPPNIKTYNTGASYRVVYNSPKNTVNLLSFGQQKESIIYDYNQDSINAVILENNGLITDSIGEIENLGLIVDPIVGSVDYETISITSTTLPFGSIGINGSATTEYNNLNFYEVSSLVKVVYSPDNTSGTLFSFGNHKECIIYNYNINSNVEYLINDLGSILDSYGTNVETYNLINELPTSFDEYGSVEITGPINPFGLVTISGSADVSYTNKNFYDNVISSKIRVAYSPDNTSGTLFSFGEKSETITYNYNLSSENLFIIDDSESITNSVTQIIDLGFITDPISEQDSYESIDVISNQLPFGTISINGSADITYNNANFYDSSISSKVRVVYSPDNTSGTLFSFSEKLESFVYNYDQNSILTFEIDTFESITTPPSEFNEFGYVNEIYSEQIDYGLDVGLGESQNVYPFGSINIFESSGNVVLGYNDVENTVLFNISGELVYPNVDYTPAVTGVGTVYISGSSDNSFVRNITTITENIVVYDRAFDSLTHSYSESSISVVGIETSYPFGTITISGIPLVHPEVDYTPEYTGAGTFNLFGSSTYSETNAFGVGRRRGGTINLWGYALYSETDAYIGIGTITLNREGIVIPTLIARTRSYVGLGTIIVSTNLLESEVDAYTGSGIISISGFAIEKTTAETPDDVQLFSIYGELNHPDIDYTPHYGIEKNVGIGTTGIQITELSSADESQQRSSVGSGSIFIENGFSPQQSYPWLPEPGVGKSWSFTRTTYIAQGSLTISTGIAQTHYYSPIYPKNSGDPSSGIGTIRINDDNELTITRAVLPYTTRGTIFLSGIGPESYTPQTEIGSGILTLSGISSTREIAVYQDFVTSGTIFISQQSQLTLEKSYVGLGTILVSQLLVERNTESYFASGTVFTLSGASETYSTQTSEQTIDIVLSGSAQESLVSQTPEDTVLYQFSSAATDEKITKPYGGTGSTNVIGSANVNFVPLYPANGFIRFVNYTSDQTYHTCDSIDFTSDYLNSADVSFVANSPETTALFNVNGSAITIGTALYNQVAVGLYTVFGTYQSIKFSRSESGVGTIFVTETSSESKRDAYVASGTLSALSGGSESYSPQTSGSTIILQISGSAITSIESDYSFVGIGSCILNGSAITSKIATYTQTGSGIVTLSGQLVYPNIIFIPSPDGFGTINILGSSNESVVKIYETSGSIFEFSSSGFESFTKSTYTGVGTIYVQELFGSTINNPYQIPRVYITIV